MRLIAKDHLERIFWTINLIEILKLFKIRHLIFKIILLLSIQESKVLNTKIQNKFRYSGIFLYFDLTLNLAMTRSKKRSIAL